MFSQPPLYQLKWLEWGFQQGHWPFWSIHRTWKSPQVRRENTPGLSMLDANVRYWVPWQSKLLTCLDLGNCKHPHVARRLNITQAYREKLTTNLLLDLWYIWWMLEMVTQVLMANSVWKRMVSGNWASRKVTEHTWMAWRILLRSAFRATIISPLFFIWTSRGIGFRPFWLTIFLCVSPPVLWSRISSAKYSNLCISGSTYIIKCSIASYADRLRSSSLRSFTPRSKALHTSAQASPSSP